MNFYFIISLNEAIEYFVADKQEPPKHDGEVDNTLEIIGSIPNRLELKHIYHYWGMIVQSI